MAGELTPIERDRGIGASGRVRRRARARDGTPLAASRSGGSMSTMAGCVGVALASCALTMGPAAWAQEPPPAHAGPLAQAGARDLGTQNDVRRGVKAATIGALGATAGLGLVLALNRPTWFGEGRCEEGDPVLGDYGCNELSLLHGVGAITSLVGYTASMTLDATTPRPPPRKPALHRALTYVHVGGLVAAPVLGLIGSYPTVFGLRDSEDLKRGLRTVHMTTAVLSFAAFTTTVALDW